MRSTFVLGVRFDVASARQAAGRVVGWAEAGECRYACVSDARSALDGFDDPAFASLLNGASLNLPSGARMVREMQARGIQLPSSAPDLALAVARRAAVRGVPVALYGPTEAALAALRQRLPRLAPGLKIATAVPRPLTAQQAAACDAQIRDSGARIVLVGLDRPHQERWAARHAQTTGAVCVAAGWSLDALAGSACQAPRWVRRAGAGWAVRLAAAPRRLRQRYARAAPRFGVEAARERSTPPGPDAPSSRPSAAPG